MRTIPLTEYTPDVYKDFAEYEAIIEADENIIDNAENALDDLISNQFISSATEEGVARYEKICGIISSPTTETLSFRKERIINRLSLQIPFTVPFLRRKLNEILGVGKYVVYIDYSNYTIYVESSAQDQSWFSEIMITMAKIKPANMVFINKPLISASLNLEEAVSYQTQKWNYALGYWKIGEKQFSSISDGGVIKMATTASLQPALLQDVAEFTATDIASVVINDSVTITTFSTKQASNGECIIEYSVPAGSVTTITSIKLKSADQNVLSSFSVYVPVLDDIIVKHSIKVKEG